VGGYPIAPNMSDGSRGRDVALRSASVLVAGRAAQLLLGIVQVRLLFVGLTREDAGLFAYVTSLAALLATLADMGATTIAAREASRAPEREAALLGALGAAKLALAGVALVAFAGAIAATLGAGAMAAVLATGLVIATSALAGADVAFQVRQAFLVPTALRVATQALLVAGLAAAAAGGGLSLDAALLVYAAATAAAPIATFVLARRLVAFPLAGPGARDLLRLAMPHGIASAFVTLYFHAGTILLRNWKGNDATAVYGAGFKLFGFAVLLPGLVMVSVLPLLARDAIENPARGRALYERVFRVFAAVSLAGLAALVNLARPLVDALYGPGRYPETAPILVVLAAALVGVGAGSVASSALVAYGGQKTWMKIAAAGAAANLAVNAALIGPLGPIAPAIATAATEALVAALAIVAVRKREGFWPVSREFPRVAIAAALAFAVSKVLEETPIAMSLVLTGLVVVAYLVRFERRTEA